MLQKGEFSIMFWGESSLCKLWCFHGQHEQLWSWGDAASEGRVGCFAL